MPVFEKFKASKTVLIVYKDFKIQRHPILNCENLVCSIYPFLFGNNIYIPHRVTWMLVAKEASSAHEHCACLAESFHGPLVFFTNTWLLLLVGELVNHRGQSSVFLQPVHTSVVQDDQLSAFWTVKRQTVLTDPLQTPLTEAVATGQAVGVGEEVHTHWTSQVLVENQRRHINAVCIIDKNG